MAQWVGVQGQVNVAKKTQKHPLFGVPPREPQAENEKVFFLFRLVEDLLNPLRV